MSPKMWRREILYAFMICVTPISLTLPYVWVANSGAIPYDYVWVRTAGYMAVSWALFGAPVAVFLAWTASWFRRRNPQNDARQEALAAAFWGFWAFLLSSHIATAVHPPSWQPWVALPVLLVFGVWLYFQVDDMLRTRASGRYIPPIDPTSTVSGSLPGPGAAQLPSNPLVVVATTSPDIHSVLCLANVHFGSSPPLRSFSVVPCWHNTITASPPTRQRRHQPAP